MSVENVCSQSGLGWYTWQLPYFLRKTMCSFHFSSLLWVLCSVPWSVCVNSYGPLWTEYEVTSWTSGENKGTLHGKAMIVSALWMWQRCASQLSLRPVGQNGVSHGEISYNTMIRSKEKRSSFLEDLGWLGLLTQVCKLGHKITNKE